MNIDELVNKAVTHYVNTVYVVERCVMDGYTISFEDATVMGVFTSPKLAEEWIHKEKKKMKAYGGLTPDFTYWIYDFVLNEGPKDEHQ